MPEPDDLAAELALLVSDARTSDAARSRLRERHLRGAAGGDATLVGMLVDLAESRTQVAVRTTSGRTIHGRVMLVATDAIGIAGRAGVVTYVRHRCMASVRPLPPGPAEPAGDRPAARPATFAVLVAALVGERPRVVLTVAGALLAGELRSAGTDVITVRADAHPPATVYIALDQVSEVSFLASG